MSDLAVFVLRNTLSGNFMTKDPLTEGEFGQAAIFPSGEDAETAIGHLVDLWQYEWAWSQQYIGRSQPKPILLEAIGLLIPGELVPPLQVRDLTDEEIAALEVPDVKEHIESLEETSDGA
jgi:hypothetical protein